MSHHRFVPAFVLALVLTANASGALAAEAGEALPFLLPATASAAAECSTPGGLTGDPGVPAPIFLSCSAHATCANGSSVTCTSGSSSCIGIDAACPSQAGYVKCGTTTTNCPPCSVGFGCTTVTCTTDAQCNAICPDPEMGGRCQTGCPNPGSQIKRCFCFA